MRGCQTRPADKLLTCFPQIAGVVICSVAFCTCSARHKYLLGVSLSRTNADININASRSIIRWITRPERCSGVHAERWRSAKFSLRRLIYVRINLFVGKIIVARSVRSVDEDDKDTELFDNVVLTGAQLSANKDARNMREMRPRILPAAPCSAHAAPSRFNCAQHAHAHLYLPKWFMLHSRALRCDLREMMFRGHQTQLFSSCNYKCHSAGSVGVKWTGTLHNITSNMHPSQLNYEKNKITPIIYN